MQPHRLQLCSAHRPARMREETSSGQMRPSDHSWDNAAAGRLLPSVYCPPTSLPVIRWGQPLPPPFPPAINICFHILPPNTDLN